MMNLKFLFFIFFFVERYFVTDAEDDIFHPKTVPVAKEQVITIVDPIRFTNPSDKNEAFVVDDMENPLEKSIKITFYEPSSNQSTPLKLIFVQDEKSRRNISYIHDLEAEVKFAETIKMKMKYFAYSGDISNSSFWLVMMRSNDIFTAINAEKIVVTPPTEYVCHNFNFSVKTLKIIYGVSRLNVSMFPMGVCNTDLPNFKFNVHVEDAVEINNVENEKDSIKFSYISIKNNHVEIKYDRYYAEQTIRFIVTFDLKNTTKLNRGVKTIAVVADASYNTFNGTHVVREKQIKHTLLVIPHEYTTTSKVPQNDTYDGQEDFISVINGGQSYFACGGILNRRASKCVHYNVTLKYIRVISKEMYTLVAYENGDGRLYGQDKRDNIIYISDQQTRFTSTSKWEKIKKEKNSLLYAKNVTRKQLNASSISRTNTVTYFGLFANDKPLMLWKNNKALLQTTEETLLGLNPVIKVDIKSVGFDDPVQSSKVSTIHINGENYLPIQRGMNFVVLKVKTGAHIATKGFDWHVGYCQASLEFVKSLPLDVMVLVASQDSAARHFGTECKESLSLIGGTAPYAISHRSSFVLIGYKGNDIAPSWITQEGRGRSQGPTYLKKLIRLKNF